MILLAVETSAAVASAAILRDGELIAVRSADPAKKHAQTVMPLLAELLADVKLSAADMDALAVDVGPGSFTGVRIGVCAVNGMALALGKPVIGVPSPDVLYEPYAEESGTVCTMIDAGNGNVYAAEFSNGVCIRQSDAYALDELLASLPENVSVVRDTMPEAGALARAAWRLRDRAAKAAAPLYVRPSQAERLYAKRMGESAT